MSTTVSQLGYQTLGDVINAYSSMDARAPFLHVVEVLDRMCPLIRYLPFTPANQILSNITSRRDSIPVPGTRQLNQGVQPTTSKLVSISDPMALFEAYSEVDEELLKLQNDPRMWRSKQDAAHVQGFAQLMESLLFYGNLQQNPGSFNGLATRFNNLESYPNGDTSWQPNVWSNGATTGACTSAWMLELGEDKVYGIYPPNTPGGFQMEDLGRVTKTTPAAVGIGPQNDAMYQVYRSHFTWRLGLQVGDERCVQRICNINPEALKTNDFDENVFIQAKRQLPSAGEAPGTVILMNRMLATQVDIRAVSQKLNAYTYFSAKETDVFGRSVTKFQNIPILISEKIINYETVIT